MPEFKVGDRVRLEGVVVEERPPRHPNQTRRTRISEAGCEEAYEAQANWGRTEICRKC